MALTQYPSSGLVVYNLPYSVNEDSVYSIFPSVKSVNMVQNHSSSNPICVLQFHNPDECEQAYNECLQGKEVDGCLLRAEYDSNKQNNYYEHHHPSSSSGTESYNRQSRENYTHQSRGGDTKGGHVLVISNLPYSATEREVTNEFPQAQHVSLCLDDQGRSRGIANVTFSNSDDCNAALNECYHKMMNGRAMRGRIQRDYENNTPNQASQRYQRDYNNNNNNNNYQRDYGNQRNFNNQRDFRNQRESDSRDFAKSREDGNFRAFGNRQGRQFDQNPGRGDRCGDGQYRGNNSRGIPRDEARHERRDRSSGRNEPIRGYGSTKGPRITSAVIHQSEANSSHSSSSDE